MTKTKFLDLLAKKLDSNCTSCKTHMKEIEQEMKKKKRINLFLEPNKNAHGIVMDWHINFKK